MGRRQEQQQRGQRCRGIAEQQQLADRYSDLHRQHEYDGNEQQQADDAAEFQAQSGIGPQIDEREGSVSQHRQHAGYEARRSRRPAGTMGAPQLHGCQRIEQEGASNREEGGVHGGGSVS